ncbi:hypothetical protein RhiJN_08657 [Ceratobasidium sp. AG-Ba]|nr:hypothetical protein RhiJN_08657 [Ceratobasidium sp. AG-Ba]
MAYSTPKGTRNQTRGFPYPTPSSLGVPTPNQLSSRPLQFTNRDERLNNQACWIPNLDEVSRADPEQRHRIFQRLAEEARLDEHRFSSKTQEAGRRSRPINSSAKSNCKPGEYASIGAAAFQLVRPSAGAPAFALPASSRPRRMNSVSASGELGSMELLNCMEYCTTSDRGMMDVPESPATAAWRMGETQLTDDMVERWAAEDKENAARLEEEYMLRLRRAI